MCVNDNWITTPGKEHEPRPSVGDIDVVINEELDAEIGMVFYELERFGSRCWYRADMFAILPDQSADEMKEETHEAIVNLETV